MSVHNAELLLCFVLLFIHLIVHLSLISNIFLQFFGLQKYSTCFGFSFLFFCLHVNYHAINASFEAFKCLYIIKQR